MNFAETERWLGETFLAEGVVVDTKTWQAQDISDKPEMTPVEILPTTLVLDMPQTVGEMVKEVRPNMPWAEDHFMERVGGSPLNPPPSHAWWPHQQRENAEHVDGEGRFSHTYPERFWPKYAGDAPSTWPRHLKWEGPTFSNRGIRYSYGDLDDVVRLLQRDPYTRQAYLPVFFPEDTGQIHRQRIPCSLGYQFMIRDYKMNIIYGIRSCDFLRHFKDDVYMTMRLAHWMTQQINTRINLNTNAEGVLDRTLELGTLYMNIGSFHIFLGDIPLMKRWYK